jgi:SRSO17 transposase
MPPQRGRSRQLQHAKSLAHANKLIGGSDAYLVIDDKSLPKKGEHSVGVAPQYASMLGKRANCQTLVSLTLARDEVPIAVGLRLFLPESWTSDPLRMAKAGVPEAFRRPRSKPEIALEEIDRLTAASVRFGAVLADAGYGLSAPFRQGLSARGLAWPVGVPKHQKVYPANVSLIFPVAGRGRPRKNQIPDQLSVAAETILAKAKWKKISWRRGLKGPLSARFSALRIRIADGPPQRILDKGQQSKRHGWSANGVHRASANTTCLIFRPTPISRGSPLPSRRAGIVSKPISR